MDAAALLRLSQEACADGGGRVLVLDPYGVVQVRHQVGAERHAL